jgi:hypothetical protein
MPCASDPAESMKGCLAYAEATPQSPNPTTARHRKSTSSHGAIRVRELMRKKVNAATYRRGDAEPVASEEMQSYRLAHPGSPSAVRRPRLSIRGDLWIAILGPSVEKGIVGIGPSVEAALRAFDTQYLDFLGPSTDATKVRDATCSRA